VLDRTADSTHVPKAGMVKVDGTAQPTALFEFKAEEGYSKLGEQQERAMPRMVERWEKGEPVYAAFGVLDEAGNVNVKVYVLQPPDSKVGLSYYGVGTSNSFIVEREILARQGALVENMNIDISNESMRLVWQELFWTAFDLL
jgi:hypothetical protein